ncbi:general secretion pathway protein GspK [Lichenicoccus sp.]|uniref:general secretion pathway protein GspK n=1 Tax=Lichenicoccus sp. TaxID=2781899 RepID=UPI003D13A1A1
MKTPLRPNGTWQAREAGFALLIVLWTLALLSLLISQIAGSGRQAVRLAGNLRNAAALQAAADGAVQEAGYHLVAGGTAHWPANGAVHDLRQDGAGIRVRLDNQAGLINPSIASVELLAGLLRACGAESGAAVQAASAMVAWRYPGAQTDFGPAAYRQAGRDYGPPGAAFESLAEIGLVLGVTPNLLACMVPHLSLYRDTDPDPNAADPVVLRAIELATGAAPALTNAEADETVVLVSAVATGPDGARAARQAVLRVEPPNQAGGRTAVAVPPFDVMTWQR